MTTRINILIISFLMAGMFGSCTDLEEEPVGLLAPESFFNNPSDAESAIMGGYGILARNRFYGRGLTMTLQLLGDQVDIGDVGTRSTRIQTNNFQFDPSNDDYSSIWASAYLAIGSANSAIDGIPGIDMDEDRKNGLIGEAMMIRALSYYHLAQLFGAVPYIDEFVTDPDALKEVTRTPVNEVYNGIIEDIQYAITVLPDVQPNNARSRVTKGTAHTMLSKVYLILGEWELAATQAELVISNAGNYNYGLVPDYRDLWDADLGDQNEHIWTADFLGGVVDYPFGSNADYIAPMTGVRGADMQGWSVTVPSPGLYPFFPDTDYRKEVSFLTETLVDGIMTPFTGWTWSRIHMAKWNINPGQNANGDGTLSDHNIVIFRYAEVLLIAAEAINEANGGPTSQAYEYINLVRERARNKGGVNSQFPEDLQQGMSQQEFREAVRDERILELAFEWKRWYDLKRWGMLEAAFTAPDSFEPHPDIQSYNTLLPIPQTEISVSPNLTQNEGYWLDVRGLFGHVNFSSIATWTWRQFHVAGSLKNEELLEFCRDRYREVLLLKQMAENGSFPFELERTKPYGYTLYNPNAMTTALQIFSDENHDLWGYETPEGKSIRKWITFLYLYVEEKEKWPFEPDVMYWEEWLVANPFLLFGAEKHGNIEWFNTWEELQHFPDED